jgi:TatD DNase family protein
MWRVLRKRSGSMMSGIRIIDTHCHMAENEFDDDLEEVLTRAMKRGILVISSAISPYTWDKNLSLADLFSNVYASTGLDPINHREVEKAIEWIEKNHQKIVAIGEAGLDHYRERDHSQRELQERTFARLIEVASTHRLPIQVHSRSAGRAALAVLQKSDAELVHMHAFDGKASLARSSSEDYGYYFSIPTSVVHSPQKQKLVKAVNIERLLLETDSPVLSPTGGARNEPSNVSIALDQVAEILHRDNEEIREVILENTLRLYTKISPSRYS